MNKVSDYRSMNTNFDGLTLNETLLLVQSMIKDFGPDAKIELDAGYNNVEMNVHFLRDETPEEKLIRETEEYAKRKKERDALLKKKKLIEKKLRDLGDID